MGNYHTREADLKGPAVPGVNYGISVMMHASCLKMTWYEKQGMEFPSNLFRIVCFRSSCVIASNKWSRIFLESHELGTEGPLN